MSAPLGPPPESLVLQQFNGLRNTVTAERLGPAELEKAKNIDLDDAGQPHRRRGYTLKAAGNFHSLWKSGTTTYVVKNGALGVLYPDYSFVQLLANVGSAPIAYVQVNGTVYFSSETVSGSISPAGIVGEWGAVASEGYWLSPVVNPTSTLPSVRGKLLGKPPLATALAYSNGRIYLAHEQTVWATELYLYDYVDKTRSYLMFEAEVTALGAVADGIYVGTETGVWFLSGPFGAMKRTPVLGVGVIPGSMIPVSSEEVVPTQPAQPAQLFMTNSGVVAGLSGGQTVNLTQEKMVFPDAQHVAALFRSQDGVNQYVAVTDNGGSPSSAARIGDYVDAEIRRFQGA